MAGNYDEAGHETDLAIKETPNDTALHEYRALIDFAEGDYNRAAGTLYAVLSAGPGWDWTTLSSQYKSVGTYTEQLRKLEGHVKSSPEDTAAHFVLAYHYITATHKEAAIKQLQEVVELQPKDQLAAQLIKGLGGEVSNSDDAAAPPAANLDVADNPPPDIDAKAIVGEHVAQRDDGANFTLDLTADDKFTWTFEQNGKKQSFDGTYKVQRRDPGPRTGRQSHDARPGDDERRRRLQLQTLRRPGHRSGPGFQEMNRTDETLAVRG